MKTIVNWTDTVLETIKGRFHIRITDVVKYGTINVQPDGTVIVSGWVTAPKK